MKNHTIFTVATFSRTSCFVYIYYFIAFVRFSFNHFQDDFYEDNLSFVCLQLHRHNFLNILKCNIFCIEVKNQ